ncbi:MAG: hypothetical protein ACKO1U_07840, partial [Bacteroidota bacterium]
DRGKNWMAMNGSLPRVAIHDLAIHPRDAEIVIGTHGRSLYVASLKEVRQLKDSVVKMPVQWISAPDITFGKRWGAKPGAFEKVDTPSVDVCYFSKSLGAIQWSIIGPKGVVMASGSDTADAGLNYTLLPLAMSSQSVAAYRKTSREASSKIRATDSGLTFLPPGEYVLRLNASGEVSEKKWKVIDPDEKK